jgi:hypothetical protein
MYNQAYLGSRMTDADKKKIEEALTQLARQGKKVMQFLWAHNPKVGGSGHCRGRQASLTEPKAIDCLLFVRASVPSLSGQALLRGSSGAQRGLAERAEFR